MKQHIYMTQWGYEPQFSGQKSNLVISEVFIVNSHPFDELGKLPLDDANMEAKK